MIPKEYETMYGQNKGEGKARENRREKASELEEAINRQYNVVCQEWLESERGWGIRPDGISLHLTMDDCTQYIKDYWEEMPGFVPDEYSRPFGEPYMKKVSAEDYRQIKVSENGIRRF